MIDDTKMWAGWYPSTTVPCPGETATFGEPGQSVTARPNWTANMQKVLVRDQLGIPMAIGMVEPIKSPRVTESIEHPLACGYFYWFAIWWYAWRLAAMLAWAGGCWLLAEMV